MHIQVIHQSAPTIPAEIQEELLAHDPRTFLLWNPRYREDPLGGWEPRWEIWKELRVSQHPDATNQRYDSDLWNSEHQCWMRKLQTYATESGEFAPADRALLIGLAMADAWASRRWYEEFIEEPYNEAEERKARDRMARVADSANYYRRFPYPIVGRHVNSGWRASRYGAL